MNGQGKKIDSLTNRYSLSKTLQFSLIPIGNTIENFQAMNLLESDEQRNENYIKAKHLIDKYHSSYIEKVLSSNIALDKLKEYADTYYSKDSVEKKEKLKTLEAELRKSIAEKFTELSKIFGKEMIKNIMPQFLKEEKDLEIINSFSKFTTYFIGFNDNRKNMYTDEEKSTGIPYRCINDNLPKFLDNVKGFAKVKESLLCTDLKALNDSFKGICGTTINDMFTVDYFTFVLSQSGIDKYNEVIGGYTKSNGEKIKGVNEYINLFNQQPDNNNHLPYIKPLYKQILSNCETNSFIPTAFKSDHELISAIFNTYNNNLNDEKVTSIKTTLTRIETLFSNFEEYSLDGIYIGNNLALTNLSNDLFKSWSAIKELWIKDYDEKNNIQNTKNYEKYQENRNKNFKSIKSFSLGYIQSLIDQNGYENISIYNYYKSTVKSLIFNIHEKYSYAEKLLSSNYDDSKNSLKKDNTSIALIKDFLDSIKALETLLKSLLGAEHGQIKNDLFYSIFTVEFENLRNIDKLYDKVRNYITSKPYSKDKYRITFNCSSLLNEWKSDYSSSAAHIIIHNGNYYIIIMNKKLTDEDIEKLRSGNDCEHIIYIKQKPDNKNIPRLFIRSKGDNFAPSIKKYNLPVKDILDIYDSKKFKTEYKKINERVFKQSLCKLIDYYKQGFQKHESYSEFNFNWKKSNQYNDISEFINDTMCSCYKLKKEKFDYNELLNLVNENKIYMFQLYNKDFSKYSKGTPNLHTMYFKMLFDERNLENVVYQLNGGAEMFYRPASIKPNDIITHYANKPIENKNPHTEKAESIFDYDLIKDKRFTKPQFSLHLPITLNFKANGSMKINDYVRYALKHCDNNYVIGIDRGERNLLYVCVIDGDGNIVKQYSLNEIINIYNGKKHTVDYHKMLEEKEYKRKKAKQNWGAVENIKELKEGYISQAVYVICQLVKEYDAVIAMEDLNSGFKRIRTKFEKQVYQKFEKMLIDKLNYMVDKNTDPTQNGGLLHAYQLTNKFISFKSMGIQNGFIFYIPAWFTSKIDPVTGFVDLLHPKYTSVENSKDFISRFDSIIFNESENHFEFNFNYDNFLRGSTDYRKEWMVCTNGERIETFRNPAKNNERDNKTVNLTNSFIDLFNSANINYKGTSIKDSILKVSEKDFFKKFMDLMKLTLQMRNSVTNTDIDYLISPVKNKDGVFYNSNNFDNDSTLPSNADANGAYNIARKLQWAISKFKATQDENLSKVKFSISNKEWLEYTQKGDIHG